MMWFTSLMVWSSFTRGKIAATELQTPIYIPQILLPVGFLILLVFAVDKLLQGGNMGGSEGHAVPVDEAAGE
jgi:TRAP-type C4-dicarboxylate transport system permease small subunit